MPFSHVMSPIIEVFHTTFWKKDDLCKVTIRRAKSEGVGESTPRKFLGFCRSGKQAWKNRGSQGAGAQKTFGNLKICRKLLDPRSKIF